MRRATDALALTVLELEGAEKPDHARISAIPAFSGLTIGAIYALVALGIHADLTTPPT